MKVTTRKFFPYLPILTCMFVFLKLTGTITWPWVWVLSPVLIPLGIALVLFAISGILYFVAAKLAVK